MKSRNILICLCTLAFSSCSLIFGGSDYKADFKDQPLQGKIGNKAWESTTGQAKVRIGDSTTTWSFNLSDVRDENKPCSFPKYETGKIMFSLKNVDKGVKQLQMGFDFAKNLTATMVYDQDSSKGPMNQIATKGAIEILEVDTTENNVIKGRIDIKLSDENSINGNFTAHVCR